MLQAMLSLKTTTWGIREESEKFRRKESSFLASDLSSMMTQRKPYKPEIHHLRLFSFSPLSLSSNMVHSGLWSKTAVAFAFIYLFFFSLWRSSGTLFFERFLQPSELSVPGLQLVAFNGQQGHQRDPHEVLQPSRRNESMKCVSHLGWTVMFLYLIIWSPTQSLQLCLPFVLFNGLFLLRSCF